eukprot:GHVQ01012677.1.p1 GENE.GHVQ01012677.1~~GHVQ01012677.1.p1  ORF type:complete len:455 (+),score=47.47 GHVQ01012677.1:475-1839(+)
MWNEHVTCRLRTCSSRHWLFCVLCCYMIHLFLPVCSFVCAFMCWTMDWKATFRQNYTISRSHRLGGLSPRCMGPFSAISSRSVVDHVLVNSTDVPLRSVHFPCRSTASRGISNESRSTDVNSPRCQHFSPHPPIVYHNDYTSPSFYSNHRFKMWKFSYLYSYLISHGLINPKLVHSPSHLLPCIRPMLLTCHSEDYVNRCLSLTLSECEKRKIGLPVDDPRVIRRFVLDLAGTVRAMQLACRWGISCNLGGGTHHAHTHGGAGFTFFNDVAVAAHVALQQGKAKRVMIVDVDVHQGDGTARILHNHPDVFTVSLHCDENYPFVKQTSDVDVGFRRGTGDAVFMKTYTNMLPLLLDSEKPDLVLYLAGVDMHFADVLGHMELSDEVMYERDVFTFKECAVKRGIPVASVLGGGYDDNRDQLARRHAVVVRAGTKIWTDFRLAESYVPRTQHSWTG